MDNQQGDVKLFQTVDNGEISVVNGVTEMTPTPETAVYLSLFGGNEQDDGSADSPFQYWGNFTETDPAKAYRSETQNLLRSLPATSGNLRKVEDAAGRDLAWMLAEGATSVEVAAVIPGLNRVQVTINITIDGIEFEFIFTEDWKAAA